MTELIVLGAALSIAFFLLGMGLGMWTMEKQWRYWRDVSRIADRAYVLMEAEYLRKLEVLRKEGVARIILPAAKPKRARIKEA